MPDSYSVQTRDAVVSELNNAARPWNGSFTAVAKWNTVYAETDLVVSGSAVLKVAVCTLTLDQTKIQRQRGGASPHQIEFGIGVNFQKLVDPTDTDALDALDYIAEQVHDFFRSRHTLTGLTGWESIEAIRPEIYDQEKLDTQRIWETLVTVTAMGWR